MSRRAAVTPRLRPGDRVIRRHRALKTVGTVLRFGGDDKHGAACVWVKWSHPTTLPNPSCEPVDDLELVEDQSAPVAPSHANEDAEAVGLPVTGIGAGDSREPPSRDVPRDDLT